MSKNYVKLVLLGDGRVGKTSILNKYINDTFNDKQEMTVNCSFYEKNIEFNGVKYTFCLWDTAGQEKFNALTNIYYRDAKGAILVYDVTMKESFSKVEKWYQELMVFNPSTVISVAGNKIDTNHIEVDKKEVSDFCESRDVDHVYTSAKTGEGLDDIFYKVAQKIVGQIHSGTRRMSDRKGIKISGPENSKSDIKRKDKGCC